MPDEMYMKRLGKFGRGIFIVSSLLLFIFLFMALKEAGEKQAIKHQELFNKYGCYPVTKYYEQCGPVEGKPGFTACEKMTKKVCPAD